MGGHSRRRRLGGQLPRRVSGGICGVAAEHAEMQQARTKNKENSRVRVQGFEGKEKRKKKAQRGGGLVREKEWGAQENAKCEMRGKGMAPLRDVMLILFLIFLREILFTI